MTVRLPPLVLALVLGMLSALAVACGGKEPDERKLLSPTRASSINEELDKISERVGSGDCLALQPAFQRLDEAIRGLPGTTDRRLRRRLAEGSANLQRIAVDECRDNKPKTTETTETQPETTETLPPETTETVPPETTETVPPETTPTPPPTTPPPTTPAEPPVDPEVPGDSGGSEAPNFAPPGQAKKGDKG